MRRPLGNAPCRGAAIVQENALSQRLGAEMAQWRTRSGLVRPPVGRVLVVVLMSANRFPAACVLFRFVMWLPSLPWCLLAGVRCIRVLEIILMLLRGPPPLSLRCDALRGPMSSMPCAARSVPVAATPSFLELAPIRGHLGHANARRAAAAMRIGARAHALVVVCFACSK